MVAPLHSRTLSTIWRRFIPTSINVASERHSPDSNAGLRRISPLWNRESSSDIVELFIFYNSHFADMSHQLPTSRKIVWLPLFAHPSLPWHVSQTMLGLVIWHLTFLTIRLILSCGLYECTSQFGFLFLAKVTNARAETSSHWSSLVGFALEIVQASNTFTTVTLKLHATVYYSSKSLSSSQNSWVHRVMF